MVSFVEVECNTDFCGRRSSVAELSWGGFAERRYITDFRFHGAAASVLRGEGERREDHGKGRGRDRHRHVRRGGGAVELCAHWISMPKGEWTTGGEGVGIVTATMRAAMRYWNGSDAYTFRTCRHQRGRRPSPAGGRALTRPSSRARAPLWAISAAAPLSARALLPPSQSIGCREGESTQRPSRAHFRLRAIPSATPR